ncbi:hypothetical protein ACERK3_15520 [Phycisphaerales bacterium AB-hyl4]|uniref:Uncharacterized protein n=1 Tax=Natronomicrosphaera hydrolytica TaxID=3242702 RepID=A0ABV4UAC7_9BACT
MSQRDSDSSRQTPQTDWSRRGAQILAVVAILVLIFVGWNLGQSGPTPQRHDNTGHEASTFPGGETPEPYYHDEENNRYWHETAPGHGHWHQGPPPPEQMRD